MHIETDCVSIIVPVYNVEKYLERCIQSLLKQTHHNIEIILVDDGSTDGSPQICDNYEKQDCRICVIHKANGGNTSARKAGLSIAKGEFIGFVDSDDWIESTMYEHMLRKMEEYEADIVCTGYYTDMGDSSAAVFDRWQEGYYDMQDKNLYANGFIIDNITGERNISSSLCNKLFRREHVIPLFDKMDDRMQYAEDMALTCSLLPNVNSIYVMRKAYYHYCSNPMSIVRSKNERLLEQINLAYLFLDSNYKNHAFEADLMREKDLIIADCLLKGVNSSFFDNRNVQIPTYMLPEFEISPKMKIGIYGAGKVGRCYYHQLQHRGYRSVHLIDKNAFAHEGVLLPEEIQKHFLDCIIIGVREQSMAEEIKRELKDKYHIEEKKIVWKKPIPMLTMCKVTRDGNE